MNKMMAAFECLFDKGHPDECWPWKGRLQPNRAGSLYGYFQKGSRANRIAYQLYCGEIPPGLVVRHSCDNSVCVNPAHLEIGTQKQNVQDREERGRSNRRKGSDHGCSKLSEKDIPEIRAMLKEGISLRRIGMAFGVSQCPIHAIAHGRSWTHIESSAA